MLLGLLGPVHGWMCCNAWRECLRRAQHGSPLPQATLLTICSQTVRILLDVAAHVHGRHAGQAHNGGRF
jgi:hypothetical protein